MNKSLKNADIIAYKLRPALTKATNHRLEIADKERQKKEEIVKKWKTKAMAGKCQRAKKQISLFSQEKESYESNIRNKIDPDQTNDKYLLQLSEAKKRKLQAIYKVVYLFSTFL